MVQVVSMLEVMMRLGDTTFQSRDVMGAVCSGDFELDKSANGVIFWGASLELTERLMELVARVVCESGGKDHNRR